jgi:uncharacterized protein (TIGR02466 family)
MQARRDNEASMNDSPTSQGEVEVRSYFPTPVVLAHLPATEALNGRLRDIIFAREKEDAGVTHSNLMGWQSADDFQGWGGAEGEKLLGFARSLADRLTGDRQGQAVKIDWLANAWANINRHGHANEFHTHPGSFWSGCYYVDDGGIAADPALGGAFEIMDPRGVAPAMYAPELAYTLAGCQSAGASELIVPAAGTMLLFPAWLSHGVRPYLGNRTRVSVAFNLSLPTGR